MSNARREHADNDRSSWPYAAMLGFGYFGSGTPEGRRHRNRTLAALAVFLLALHGATIPSLPWAARVICAVGVPMSWAAIVWSSVRYLAALDELSRLIQLEAAALSYGVAIILASAWFALGALRVLEAIDVPASLDERTIRSVLALVVPASILMAEVLRGVLLVALARSRR